MGDLIKLDNIAFRISFLKLANHVISSFDEILPIKSSIILTHFKRQVIMPIVLKWVTAFWCVY